MVTNNNSPCPGLPGSTSSSANVALNFTNTNHPCATSSVGAGGGSSGLIVSGSCNEGGGVSEGGVSEGGSISPGGSISVATISAASSGNGPSGAGGPSLIPVGIPFLSGLGPDPSSPFYPGHPGAGFDLKENMEAWRSIPAYASMYGGYDNTFFTGYPMLRNGYGMDLNGSRRKNATRETTSTLKAWLNDHRKNPYPTKAEKIMLAIITQMSLTQVSTWFANARRRLKKENKMTWSPRNRCDDDDDDCKDGGFNSSTDTRDVDGTPLGSVNHHRSASSLHSNGAKDLVEPDSDIDVDDDSSSDNLIDKKRFKRNESPLSDSGGSGITISATSTLGDHHHHHHHHHQPSLHHPSWIHRFSVNSLTNLHHNHHHHLPPQLNNNNNNTNNNTNTNNHHNHHHHHPTHHNNHHNHHLHPPHHNHHHQNNNQSYTGIQNAAILPATSKPRIWSIVDIAISNNTNNTNASTNNNNNTTSTNNNSSTRPVSTSSPTSSAISTTSPTPTSKSSSPIIQSSSSSSSTTTQSSSSSSSSSTAQSSS